MNIKYYHLPPRLAQDALNLMQPILNESELALPFLQRRLNSHPILIDLRETDTGYQIDAALPPGATKANTTLALDNEILTIRVKSTSGSESDKRNYLLREIETVDCRRRFKLPDDVQNDSAKAEFVAGILKITFSKRVASTPDKEITIE